MLVLNPTILIYPKTINGVRFFVAETDSASAPVVIQSPIVAMVLINLKNLFTQEEVSAKFLDFGLPKDTAEDLCLFFRESKIFLSQEELGQLYPTKHFWYLHGWQEAFKYHYSTKDYPFLKMNEPNAFEKDKERMIAYKTDTEVPSIYQTFPFMERVWLEKIPNDDKLNDLVNSLSESERRGVKGIGILFDLCFGERARQKFNVQGSFLKKSIPSGGSRHPTEIFFTLFDENCGMDTGIYHYNVQNNSLDLLHRGNFQKEVEGATFDLFTKYKKKPYGVLIFTTLHERAMWRYRDSRSWRAVLIDLGHAIMMYRTVAHRLGFKTYTYQKFKDDIIARLLGINPVSQTPFYVGTLV